MKTHIQIEFLKTIKNKNLWSSILFYILFKDIQSEYSLYFVLYNRTIENMFLT